MSFAPMRRFLRTRVTWRQLRFYATPGDPLMVSDIRFRLMNEVKLAMKNKNSAASTTLRSVLADIYAADKVAKEHIPTSTIINIMRKAVTRRVDAAVKFAQASRLDLADKEKDEAEMLSKFLPPLLSEEEIDRALSEIIESLPQGTDLRKCLGRILKEFYFKVDKSSVDMNIVKRKVMAKIANVTT